MRRGLVAVALLVLVPLAISLSSRGIAPASAHDWRGYYNYGTYTSRWDVQDIPWYFEPNYWNQGAAFQDRAIDAAATWSGVLTNGYAHFTNKGVVSWTTYEQCAPNNGVNYVRYAELTGAPATTWHCYRPQPSGDEWSVTGFAITFDSSPQFEGGAAGTWYPGTGQGAWNQINVLDVATHEFGHASGQALHFDEPSLCPDDPAADHTNTPTMCAGSWYGDDTNRRTLQDHDVHTLVGAYTAPPEPPPPPTTTTTRPPDAGPGVGKPGCDLYRASLPGGVDVNRVVHCV
jgi:hypothetical protein